MAEITIHKSWNEDRSVGVWGHWEEYSVCIPVPEFGFEIIIGVEPNENCYTPDMPGARNSPVQTWEINYIGINREGWTNDSPSNPLVAVERVGGNEHIWLSILPYKYREGLRLADFGYKVVKAVKDDWLEMVKTEEHRAKEENEVMGTEAKAWDSGP